MASAKWLNGDQAPSKSLPFSETAPVAVEFDSAGLMYVAAYEVDGRQTVAVYPAAWTSTTEPLKVLEGDLTQLSQPISIAFDKAGRMYVANIGKSGVAGSTSITVYDANWASGNTAPIKILKGDRTGLVQPFDIAFDSAGRMYVASLVGLASSPGRITAYDANWASGNTAPIKTLEGAKSGLNYPSGIAFDKTGAMYVVNFGLQNGTPSVAQFRANWAAGDAPTKVLTGAATGLDFPTRIAFDSASRMYVANGGLAGTSPRITGYAPKWKAGNTAPISTLAGSKSMLTKPLDLAFDKDGRLAVTNADPEGIPAVLLFSPPVSVAITGKRTSPTLITLTGRTTGIAKGTSVVAYVRPAGSTGAFQAQKAIKIAQGNLAAGTFTYRISGLKSGTAYQVYVVASGQQSKTITVRR